MTANSGSPIPLPAAFHAAYKATGTATVQVYTSDQTLVRTLTKPILTTDGTTDAGTPMTWDGRGEPAWGQPGAVQPRGVYLFQWTLTDSLGVSDSDKSPWLSITQTESALTGDYDPPTDKNTTKDGCVLTDRAMPRADALAANVQVYGGDSADMASIDGFVPWTQIVAPLPLPSLTTNAPGASPPVWDEVTFPEAIQMEEVHLFCAQDSHAATDRGGRDLWALQKNQAPKHPRADNYDFITPGAADATAKFWQKTLRDATQAPTYNGSYASHANGAVSAQTLLNNMYHDGIMFYSGEGAEAPYYGGASITGTNIAGTKIFEQPGAGYDPTKNWRFLQNLQRYPDGSGALKNMLLGVWEGCYTGLSDPTFVPVQGQQSYGDLVEGTYNQGAKCAVGFTTTVWFDSSSGSLQGNPRSYWANAFWQALAQGKNILNTKTPDGHPTSVSQAMDYATAEVTKQWGGSDEGYGGKTFRGLGALHITPISAP